MMLSAQTTHRIPNMSTSPARKSAVSHCPPNFDVISNGSVVNQPDPEQICRRSLKCGGILIPCSASRLLVVTQEIHLAVCVGYITMQCFIWRDDIKPTSLSQRCFAYVRWNRGIDASSCLTPCRFDFSVSRLPYVSWNLLKLKQT